MTRERRRSSTFCALTALAFPFAVLAQGNPVGNEFQVNTYTTSHQNSPSVAVDGEGDFIVAWTSKEQDGNSFGVFARLFSSAGTPSGGEFQVNTYTVHNQSAIGRNSPWIAAAADGDFVVAWLDYIQEGAGGPGVFARLFTSAGAPLTGEIQVASYIQGAQDFITVAADDDGDFVAAWDSERDGSGRGIFTRRFSSAGAPLTDELEVNTYTTDHQVFPAVAADVDGDFVIAWQSPHDGSNGGVFARRFSSAGAALGSEFQVNTYTNNFQRYPAVATAADGDFVVVWQSYSQDSSHDGVFAQRFSSAGAALGSEFQVNTYTTNNQYRPTVAAEADGDFVVTWNGSGQGDGYTSVFGRRFSSAGAPQGGEFRVNTYVPGFQNAQSVAMRDGGAFVVAWQSEGQDGQDFGIFAQRFAAPLALDIDGNGFTQPLTDGLLVLRRFFGFTGATLTNSAVGGGCTRCDAAAIEPYIAGLGLVLDIDGNGSLGALTDGLLALRFLFGFTGATLTTGAIGGSCTRCDANAIEPYLAGLTA